MATSGRPISRANFDDRLVGLLLLGDAVLLDLEVDVLGAEDLDEVVEVGARVVRRGPRRCALAEARGEAAGERDDALGVARRAGSRSTAGLPRCRPSRKPALESLTRLRKPSSVGGEQRQVVALDLAGSRRVRSSTK